MLVVRLKKLVSPVIERKEFEENVCMLNKVLFVMGILRITKLLIKRNSSKSFF